jgi:hypothetical protein
MLSCHVQLGLAVPCHVLPLLLPTPPSTHTHSHHAHSPPQPPLPTSLVTGTSVAWRLLSGGAGVVLCVRGGGGLPLQSCCLSRTALGVLRLRGGVVVACCCV